MKAITVLAAVIGADKKEVRDMASQITSLTTMVIELIGRVATGIGGRGGPAPIARGLLIVLLATLAWPGLLARAATEEEASIAGITGWTYSIITTLGKPSSPSVAVDPSGKPHVVYVSKATGKLKYARWTGSAWVSQTVASKASYGSLAIDNAGNPHVGYIYYEGNEANLIYARWTGSAWVSQTVDSGWGVGYASLALDSAGNPHFGYYKDYPSNLTPDSLHHVRWTGSYWDKQVTDPKVFHPTGVRFALDSSGNAHFSYSDWDGYLWYAKHTASGWSFTKVIRALHGATNGFATSVAVDGWGKPHIVYSDILKRKLMHAQLIGSTWTFDVVESGRFIYPLSLVTDSDGLPYVAYDVEMSNKAVFLKYARWTGISWAKERVSMSPEPSVYPSASLVLDRWDRLHIVYDRSLSSLWYAVGPATWDTGVVDSVGYVGRYASLALDAWGRPGIAYYDATNRDLKLAWRLERPWDVQTVDSLGNVGKFPSLAFDSSGDPHISYQGGRGGQLKYARWTGAGWDIQVVDNSLGAGEYSSLALTSSGLPRIAYYDKENGDLKYAWWDGTNWGTAVVDGEGDVGMYASLELDGSDRPHIAYYDTTNQDLKYATPSRREWQIATVDWDGDVGMYVSLALDPSGWPHMSYYDATKGDLKYSYTHDGSAWAGEVVDDVGNVGLYSSLFVDQHSNAWISYHDATNKDLKVVRELMGAWAVQTVDKGGWVGLFSSIAVDGEGHAHVGYYTMITGNLMYAHSVTAN